MQIHSKKNMQSKLFQFLLNIVKCIDITSFITMCILVVTSKMCTLVVTTNYEQRTTSTSNELANVTINVYFTNFLNQCKPLVIVISDRNRKL